MVVCKCHKETQLYCCAHKVPVCGDCICLPEHYTCEVRTYAEWMVDASCIFLPKCSLCLQTLNHTSDSVTRLGCLHVLHTSCLHLFLKGSSSPTGYTCPSCKSQNYIYTLDKNALLPLASELLSNLSTSSEQGSSQPLSATRSTFFSLSSPVAEMYKDLTNLKAHLNYIPSAQTLAKSRETLPAQSTMIDIEPPESYSPEVMTAEPVGSPKHATVFSRKCSFRGEKKIADCPIEDCAEGSINIPNGTETEHFLVSYGSVDKPILPLTSPTHKSASKSHGIQDATDGRWRRHRRAAIIDPTKILLLFATLSSMGTMILIYFTLQSEKLVKVLYT